jgi:hypothetical protein
MSSADETYQQMKLEKGAFRRMADGSLKSRLKSRQCKGCGGTMSLPPSAASSVGPTYCGNCQILLAKQSYGSAFANQLARSHRTCPRCKNPKIITEGRLCRECVLKTAYARKKDLQDSGNLAIVKHMLKTGQSIPQTAANTFDNSQYNIERKMRKHNMQLTMPKYQVRRV